MTVKLDPKRYDVAIKQLQKLLSENDVIIQKQTTVIEETREELGTFKILVTDEVNGVVGEFEILKSDIGTFQTVVTENLNAQNIKVETIEGDVADFKLMISKDLEATNARIENLVVGDLDAEFVKVDQANIDQAWVEDLMVTGKFLADDFNAATGSFSKWLTGVNIVGDNIKAGTISTDRLIIRDPDTNKGILYEINNGAVDQTDLTEEELKRLCIDGKILVAESVTADKINVTDLFSQNITATGDFNLGKGGAFVYDSETDTISIRASRVYMGSDSTLQDTFDSVDEMQEKVGTMTVWNHTAFSIDEGETLVEITINGALESGAIKDDGTDDDETEGHLRTDYIRLIPGEMYTWVLTDNEAATLPTTYFYESVDGETFAYLRDVNTSSITAPASDMNIYVRAKILTASEIENINGTLTLSNLETHLQNGADLYLGTTATLEHSPPYSPSSYVWGLPDNEMQEYINALIESLDGKLSGNLSSLTDRLYAEDGTIPSLEESIGGVGNRVSLLEGYVDIDTANATIALGKKGVATTVTITDKNISFKNDGVEGASIGYVDDEKTSMMAGSIHVTETFPRTKVDGAWIGNLCWIARSNGHLSLKVVE